MIYTGETSVLANALLVLLSLAAAAFIYLKFTFSYWPKRNVITIPPEIPFGNFKSFILQRSYLGEQIKYLYNEGKCTGKPYIGIYMMWRPILLLLDPEICKTVFTKDFQYFNARGNRENVEKNDPLSGHLVNLNGTKWKFMRNKLTPTFSSGKMKMMFPTVVNCAEELNNILEKHCAEGKPLEIKDIMARFTTDVIGSCAFGIECNSLKEPDSVFRKQGKLIFETTKLGFLKNILLSNAPKVASFLKLTRFSEQMTNFFMNLVQETIAYRENNNVSRNDFMQLMIQLKNKGCIENENETKDGEIKKLTMEQIAAQSFVFFAGGFETSSTTLSSIMYELSLHQDIQEKLRNEINDVMKKYDNKLTYEGITEMTYMEKVINETMRLHPVGPITSRKCTKDYTFPNTNLKIKAGTSVFIPIIGFHTDPQYFPNPEVFDPERFSPEEKAKRHHYTFLPFGEGPRICIGLRFAMIQMKIGLVSLLKNHKFSLNSRTDVPLKQNPRLMIYNIVGGVWVNVETAG